MKLLLYGAGGLAKEIYDIVNRCYPDRYEKIYFIDDFVEEAQFYLSETIHFDSIKCRFENLNDVEGVVAVGEPAYRDMLSKRFDKMGIKLATIIDKTALVSPTARIAEGTIVCEFSTIHADVELGRSVLIQPYADVGHDIKVGNYSVLSSNCAPGGESVFGERVYVGMNATTKEKIKVGDNSIIAMGSSVFRDVDAESVVVGNPARVTKGNLQHRVFE
ncbi:MAG: acetyltransferase [Oribacterium sp.]|nr:acetyltransferase [Oribacterium sp.]